MRDIKFRAWRKGEMYDGLGIEKLLSMAAKVGFEDNAISPVIWMQYTGLKDKNGVEIYDGDVVRTESGVFELTIEDSSCIGLINGEVTYNYNEDYYEGGHSSMWPWGAFEVIGNIHQNPELLEELSE